MPRLASPLGLALVVVIAGSSALGQEWPRFRGPNGSGIVEAANLPAQWTDKDYAWKVKFEGVGYSSPVVWGSRVFLTSANEEDATLYVFAVAVADGNVLWKRAIPSVTYPKHKFNSFSASTPALDSERVYVTWAEPKTYRVSAMDQASGRELWQRDLGPFASQHGFGASPIVFEDLVIVANEQDGKSSIVALHAKTGETRWDTPRRTEKAAFSTPCIYQPEGGPEQLILSSWAHGISSLDPRTGKPNWEVPLFVNRVVGSPAIAGSLIFAAAGTGGAGKQMLAVRPADPQRGVEAKLAYEVTKPLPYVPTPVAYGPLLFVWHDNGVVVCLDAPTGKVHWQQRIGGDFFGSPIRVGDRLYCISREGDVVVLAATDTFKQLGKVALGERSQSTPAVAHGVMYLRTLSQLMALGPTK